MRWLKYGDIDKQFGVLRLTVYDQRCDGVPYTCPPDGPAILDQSQRWDNIVVSKTPIGPIGEDRGVRSTAARDRTAVRSVVFARNAAAALGWRDAVFDCNRATADPTRD
jgi:hypothetical protein